MATVTRDEERTGQPGEGRMPFPIPYLGRSVRIVGLVKNVDPSSLPHPMNQRGELGRALYNWRHNYVSHDPLGRIAFDSHSADRRHIIGAAVRRAAAGEMRPERMAADDPKVMTQHIKRVAHYLGLDVVGVGKTHPAYLYAGRAVDPDTGDELDPIDGPEVLSRKLPFMIAGSVAWDYNLIKAHRHHVGDAAYDFTQNRTGILMRALEGYIKELGYHTLRGATNGHAASVACGIGELGRNGLVITEKFGARVHAGDAILTDLPLVPDEPLDIGVDAFCKVCKKCANTCPTNSISFGDKVVHNGVEKYKINWETCYRLRPIMIEWAATCHTCVTVCPYTKPKAWWHDLAISTLKHCPVPLRTTWARGLKLLDDWIWGTVANKRVRWLGYDTAIKPGEKACTIEGCTANHGDTSAQTVPVGDIGYYPPLKENTNRFVKR